LEENPGKMCTWREAIVLLITTRLHKGEGAGEAVQGDKLKVVVAWDL
jgi:hypothetical protein